MVVYPDGEALSRIAALVEAGSLRAVIDHVRPPCLDAHALSLLVCGKPTHPGATPSLSSPPICMVAAMQKGRHATSRPPAQEVPLHDVADAHTYVERGHTRGKVAVIVRQERARPATSPAGLARRRQAR